VRWLQSNQRDTSCSIIQAEAKMSRMGEEKVFSTSHRGFYLGTRNRKSTKTLRRGASLMSLKETITIPIGVTSPNGLFAERSPVHSKFARSIRSNVEADCIT